MVAGLMLLFGASCGVQQATFYRSPAFNQDATFKVVTLNTNDVLVGRLEHFLLINNFRVISDNSFRLPGATGFPSPLFPMDTSLFRPGQMVINIPYMDEKPSDYILRYQFDNPPASAGSKARSSLNIAVVNTKTGETEVSFLTQQTGPLEQPRLDRVIRDFIVRMRRR
jgi:hypothetical protein